MSVTLPSPLFVIQDPLQQAIIDKDTGEWLAAGVVSYFSDPEFTTPKDVYEVSNAPDGTYYFSNVGSVLTLSSIGTFVDIDGNNFIPMLFPWSGTVLAPGNFEPYYITVYSAAGVLQFTITGYPYNGYSQGSTSLGSQESPNQILNPQFSQVLFPTASEFTYPVSGADSIQFAPNWFMDVSGSGTVKVLQQPLSVATPSSAPYSIRFTTSSDVTCSVVQRFYLSPRMFEATTIAGYFEAAAPTGVSQLLTMNYIDSTPTTYTIASGTTENDGSYTAIKGAVAIDGTTNANAPGSSGYVDISVALNANSIISLTSFQVISVPDTDTTPDFIQLSVPYQEGQLLGYWQPKLAYKPIPSYLVGWDFPLNPTQPNGEGGGLGNLGANNKSNYIWDQTILFASQNNTLIYDRNSVTSGLNIASSTTTSAFALIQYIPAVQAQALLSQKNAISLKGFIYSGSGTLTATASLYWTSGALPSLVGPNYNSLVTSVSSSGIPTVDAAWNVVPNINLGNNPSITLTTTNTEFTLSGYDASGTTVPQDTVTYMAIVIAVSPIEISQRVCFDYVGLFGGDIATRPAPQTPDEVLRECRYYYESTYPIGVAVGTAATYAGAITQNVSTALVPQTFGIVYSVQKYQVPTFHLYTPVSGVTDDITVVANVNGTLTPQDFAVSSYWTTNYVSSGSHSTASVCGISYIAANNNTLNSTGTPSDRFYYYHWSADARLGVI